MGLRDRLERLERNVLPETPGPGPIPPEVADYLAVLAGGEVEERHDPALEAYFEELEEQQEEIERRRVEDLSE